MGVWLVVCCMLYCFVGLGIRFGWLGGLLVVFGVFGLGFVCFGLFTCCLAYAVLRGWVWGGLFALSFSCVLRLAGVGAI